MQHNTRIKMKGKKGFEIAGNAIVYLIIIMALVLLVAAIYYIFVNRAPDASAIKFSR